MRIYVKSLSRRKYNIRKAIQDNVIKITHIR